ncbi:corticotropin-releasing factor receptor 2-like, partial [Hyalella azteca]|uniref:Corticotropin-releasing factor receptor 2-like n=1 Tax=Hyalella azteca TaxID=294128 RepID=A0A979FKS7_HYAAZ
CPTMPMLQVPYQWLPCPCFRSLKCTRVSIHKNLFVSFLVNNVLWLVWTTVVTSNTRVLLLNPVRRPTPTSGCCVTLMRIFSAVSCWMDESSYNYFMSLPVVLSMFLNLVFLVNIVRVLVTKLRAANAPPTHAATRKAVRATLILVPLLGLHYLLTPFRPSSGSAMEKSYLILSAIASSFQYKASLADGLTQVTAFNAAGDEDDVWPSLSPRPSPCASPSPQAYGGDKPHEGGRQLSPYGPVPAAARATEERKGKIPKNKTDSVSPVQEGSNIEKQPNQEEIRTN